MQDSLQGKGGPCGSLIVSNITVGAELCKQRKGGGREI